MEIGRQFALFGPPRSIPHQGPKWEPEIGVTRRDTSTQMWEGHNNPQLPMFLTAREIKHNYAPLSEDRYDEGSTNDGQETDDELWERKAQESDERGLTQVMNDQNWQFDQAVPVTRPPSHAARPVEVPSWQRDIHFPKEPVDEELHGTNDDPRPQILDGHHRIAAADDWGIGSPDALIPVVHVPPNRMSDHIGHSAKTL